MDCTGIILCFGEKKALKNRFGKKGLPKNTTCLRMNFRCWEYSKQTHITLPTYWGSDPIYSSRTKNWFHTQPRLTRWKLGCTFLSSPTMPPGCSFPSFLCGGDCRGVKRPLSNRNQRNSNKQFLVSIGNLFSTGWYKLQKI